ncbi:uncharacterized protein V6R79_008707 [Siganus canaliculatus]
MAPFSGSDQSKVTAHHRERDKGVHKRPAPLQLRRAQTPENHSQRTTGEQLENDLRTTREQPENHGQRTAGEQLENNLRTTRVQPEDQRTTARERLENSWRTT